MEFKNTNNWKLCVGTFHLYLTVRFYISSKVTHTLGGVSNSINAWPRIAGYHCEHPDKNGRRHT